MPSGSSTSRVRRRQSPPSLAQILARGRTSVSRIVSWSDRAWWPSWSSKPVRRGSPTLARFDSGVAPSDDGQVPLDDRRERQSRREGPERGERLARANRLSHRTMAVAVEQRRLQRDGHRLDEPARALLVRLRQRALDARAIRLVQLD